MTDHEERDLRRELTRRERGRGKRYPSVLRQRIAVWARWELARGHSVRDLARRLAVHRDTLAAWLEDAAATSALVPVEVIATPIAPATTSSASGSYRVVSPSGFRVEGLTLDEAAELLVRLR